MIGQRSKNMPRLAVLIDRVRIGAVHSKNANLIEFMYDERLTLETTKSNPKAMMPLPSMCLVKNYASSLELILSMQASCLASAVESLKGTPL